MLVAGLLRIKKINFQGFIMSQAPQNLPKRTRVLVKDILFQEKYRLTHTQVDIMAYIINAMMWATKVGSFFPLTTKKFHQDLPQISEKTLEESLRVLKAMELIEVQMITVPYWGNAYVRGISVLPNGLAYNASYYKADEKKIIDNLEKQVSSKDQEIEQLREELKNIQAIEVPENSEKIEEEAKIIEEAKEKVDDNDTINYDDLGFIELIKTVIKEFGTTAEPICNSVEGWDKKTTFYINSYNKLSILSPKGEVVQLRNPIEVNKFWRYIDKNRDQIGNLVDFKKQLILDIEKLNKRYIEMHITLNNTQFQVHKLKQEKDGVKVLLKDRNTGNLSTISRNGEAIIFEIEKCEKVLLGLRS